MILCRILLPGPLALCQVAAAAAAAEVEPDSDEVLNGTFGFDNVPDDEMDPFSVDHLSLSPCGGFGENLFSNNSHHDMSLLSVPRCLP